MKSRETLASHESFRAQEAGGADASRARAEIADRIYESRATMLETLAAHIGTSLFAVLARKIEYERTTLIALLKQEEKATAERRRLDKVLPSQYFVYRTLDTNVL